MHATNARSRRLIFDAAECGWLIRGKLRRIMRRNKREQTDGKNWNAPEAFSWLIFVEYSADDNFGDNEFSRVYKYDVYGASCR